ncbi:allatostatin-A receptor [Bactrocera neohumeralis]|uniref:allatostatin-A receptor n=1 Tax=Bactrocera neohumeralis TaxID=98809 RepID=UPI002165494F|nr:allatostatin-A receptor [Bactrocera neohumeralis]XP_050316803.1 allatostatin-A receptor [Bactrocera neohumeralis]XP_050316804.1 allatostatin-A receptor [Bactrocera neohumeralis]
MNFAGLAMNLSSNLTANHTIYDNDDNNNNNELHNNITAHNNSYYYTSNSNSSKMLEAQNITTALLNATTQSLIDPEFEQYEEIDELSPELRNFVRIVVPFCFGIFAVSGFFGNTLVILVVLFNQQMHSTTNLLIVNLAVADLLFVVFCIPFTATDYITEYWPFGDLWCRAVQYLIVVTAFASIYTLVLMSVDRFLAVVHPIRSRQLRTEKVTKIAIVTMWVIILSISFPVPLVHGLTKLEPFPNVTYAFCTFYEDNLIVSQTSYQLIFFACSYLLPLMAISGLYVRMIMRLWHQGSGVQMSVKSQRGRKRVTRLVVVVVVAFASLWLPVQLILLLKTLGIYHSNTKFKLLLQVIAQTLAYMSSCINPLLYAFLSDNFRKAFYKAIHCSERYQNYSSDLPPPRRTSCARTSTTGL